MGVGGRRAGRLSATAIAVFVVFLLLGLGPGAAYAGLGIGLVLTYRTSGVLNLGHGSLALYPTYVFAELRDRGDLVLPGIPGSLHLGDIGTVPSLLVALVVAALVGLVAHALVFRPLRKRGAPPLASVVAAVGIHVVLEVLVALRFGESPRLAPTVLPNHTIDVAGMPVLANRLYLAAIVIVVGLATAALQSRTRFGRASRAVAEDETAAALLGYSADRLGALNWMLGAMLAGLFGILLAPMTGLSPSSYSFLVVPALATAVAGGFSSIGVTVAAGLALGVAQSLLIRVELPVSWLGPQVLRSVAPFVALAVAVAARGALVPRRGAPHALRLPPADIARQPARLVATLALVGSLALVFTDGEYRAAVVVTMLGALVCLSLVLLAGYGGQISLAQMSFAGVAGFALSAFSADGHLPFPLAPLLAAAGAGVCGVIVGIPALRARGVSFAVMTLGGALAVDQLVFRNLSKGVLASNTIAPAHVAGVDLSPISSTGAPTARFGFLVLGVLSLAAYGVMTLRRSRFGRRLVAVRTNERAAAAAGVNVAATKLVAFGLSGFLAGLGGALMGYHQGAVSAESFTLTRSFAILAAAYLGGIGSVAGALFGGLIVAGGVLPTALDSVFDIGAYQPLLSGVAMIAVAVNNPEGITRRVRDRLERGNEP